MRVLLAAEPGDVQPLLAEVQAYQQQGRFVAGYLAYEAGAAFGLSIRDGSAGTLPVGALACNTIPLAWMAVYPAESAVIIPAAEWTPFLDSLDTSRAARLLTAARPELNVSKDEYREAIGRVRDFIAAGDTYQVNYTVRARYQLAGADPLDRLDPLEYFLALLVRQPVPYAAYLDLGDTQVISLSPELFLRRDDDRLESRPMKGTRPRGQTHAADVALAHEVVETEKERAENLMIVDMVRNDLGRVCRTGSVHVPVLYALEPYRTVWQMTSTVQGELEPGASLIDIMRAVFPGASITGAPKHHTMEIIAEMETEPRGVYTGTVVLFSPGVTSPATSASGPSSTARDNAPWASARASSGTRPLPPSMRKRWPRRRSLSLRRAADGGREQPGRQTTRGAVGRTGQPRRCPRTICGSSRRCCSTRTATTATWTTT